MAHLPLLTIIDPSSESDDALDQIAGIPPARAAEFVGHVCVELGALLEIAPNAAALLVDYHLDGPVVRCKPICLGMPLEAQAELRAFAREVAMAIVAAVRPRTASERAA